ncbi:hypothetical protein KL921_001915 [Ogataea angusta]|nr:hypothetical protein KL921_001915 [Ogataea angusta]KAG7835222.1 hypothetical protein KL943_002537 [Ogataea angusta]KAG7848734.1 hypothetical protein KL941_001552 [Ogataea angusta]
MSVNASTFEFTVLGCSGGPVAGKTCAFLLKPSSISFEQALENEVDCILALDAGAGVETIAEMITDCRKNTASVSSYFSQLYNNTEDLNYYSDNIGLMNPHPFEAVSKISAKSSLQLAKGILNCMSAYIITHPHLDHVLGLVINSPCFTRQTPIYGTQQTIDNLKNHIFNGKVWPTLSYLSFNYLQPCTENFSVTESIAVETFHVSHGITSSTELYKSSAFLFTETNDKGKLLFFGDVESDLSSNTKYNQHIWLKVADHILTNKLKAIVIECSSVDKKPGQPLFGHMTPTNLISELLNLQNICLEKKKATRHPLAGLNVLIIHVKETFDHLGDPRKQVLESLRRWNQKHDLRINFTICMPGISYFI